MKQLLCTGLLLLAMAWRAAAATLPAEQLLPNDTFFVAGVKDWDQAAGDYAKSCTALWWNDEAMKPFRDKFMETLKTRLLEPVERDFKIKLAEFQEILRGQVVFAMTPAVEAGGTPGFLVVIDAKDKAEVLKTRLAETRKRWADAGQEMKLEKIREVEFTTLVFSRAQWTAQLERVFPSGIPGGVVVEGGAEKLSLLVGVSQSLLVVGNQTRDLEKVLARQGGGAIPALADHPAFQANHAGMLRDAPIYAWLNFKPVYDNLIKPSEAPAPGGLTDMQADKVLPALGLDGLKSIAGAFTMNGEGAGAQVFFTAPQAARQGVLKLLALPPKDSSPPPFVPADAVKFQRMRLDFQQGWATFETALTKISPSLAGLVQLMINAAGKDKDPDFDLKKNLVNSVGDDFISYEKNPRAPVLGGTPPSITLISALNTDQMLNGVKVLISMLPEPMGTTALKEREFLGRKVFAMTTPATAAAAAGELHFAAHGGYLAFSSDAALLEEYLRSGENAGKPLRDTPGLGEAAQKVGGMGSGWFGFENGAETMRVLFEQLKADPKAAPLSGPLGGVPSIGDELSAFRDWFDYSLMPPWDRVAKYFYFNVFAVGSTPEGVGLKYDMPTPPALRK